MTIYLTDDAFGVKAKRFNKMFTSISALFFSLRFTRLLWNLHVIIHHDLRRGVFVTNLNAKKKNFFENNQNIKSNLTGDKLDLRLK